MKPPAFVCQDYSLDSHTFEYFIKRWNSECFDDHEITREFPGAGQ